MSSLSFSAIRGLPEVRAGDDLATLISTAGHDIRDRDVIVVAQKIVSKAEGRTVRLRDVEPRPEARELAERCKKDPRIVELVLGEASEVLRAVPGVLIVRHRLGFVIANAGVDQSNVPGAGECALLLPENPDASAHRLRDALSSKLGAQIAVLVSDSFGRAWRHGVIGTCIGCAGLRALHDRRGEPDREGRKLEVTQVAVADPICAAATLVMGEAAEGQPVIVVRGLAAEHFEKRGRASDLIRPPDQDLFR